MSDNSGAIGDNRNALAMADIQNLSLFNGGTATIQEHFNSIVADVGISAREGQASLDVETALLSQAEISQQQVSGVNLDEEAANLLRYQQAYQASAQLIQVSEELFQVLINSFR